MSPRMPERGQTGMELVLVTGGGGYVGSVLVRRLLDRGYGVRVLDALDWGTGPLADVEDRIELVAGDIRDAGAIGRCLEGADGVVALAGLTNDATAERDPQANWETNALATEMLARECLERGVERVVYASSCSLYDGLGPGLHDESSEVVARGEYARAKLHGERALLETAEQALSPVVLRNGTVFGWSPRMRFDLVVNTFVMAALTEGRLVLHGGGRMTRPLVGVGDAADAAIAALEAPATEVRGEIFNVVHDNLRVRDVAELVAEEAEASGRSVELESSPAPAGARDYGVSGRKLKERLGFQPARTVREAVRDLIERLSSSDSDALRDPRYYNVRWLERSGRR
jgi:nucleoside-diphosphate-sugar epimerase